MVDQAERAVPPSGGLLHRIRALLAGESGSLFRNGFSVLGSTVIASLVGYVYWVIAARSFTPTEVGRASGIVSIATGMMLFSTLGLGSMLISRLPRLEGQHRWGVVVGTVCAIGSFLGGLLTFLAIIVMSGSHDIGWILKNPLLLTAVVIGAASLAIVSVSTYVFISARKASKALVVNTIVAISKLILLIVLRPVSTASVALLVSWAVSDIIGAAYAMGYAVPRLRMAPLTFKGFPSVSSRDYMELAGHQTVTVAGALVPYILPVLVLLQLNARQNAFFYTAWMVAGAVFLVGPSIGASLYAETVRHPERQKNLVTSALKATFLGLGICFVGLTLTGHLVLSLFGHQYSQHSYWTLVVLSAGALPDSIKSLGMGVLRSQGKLKTASILSVTTALITCGLTWFLLPVWGIIGAAFAWGLAQTFAALFLIPYLRHAPALPDDAEELPASTP
jgi:O-antigen/teichoic acid export membrane protein